MTADEYLYDTEESNRIRELTMSRVSEPASPFFGHQALVLRVAKIWSDHVEPRKLGRVAIAPCDVVLDRDRGQKLAWYRQYGVRECWLVDLYGDSVTMVDFTGPSPVERVAKGGDSIRSAVLPELDLSALGLFS